MEKTNDVIITLINGGFYEIFLIFAMYYSFVILLGMRNAKEEFFYQYSLLVCLLLI